MSVVSVSCKCGAEWDIENFPVDEADISKRDAIELANQHELQSCPNCDPDFDFQTLDFKPKPE